MTSNAGGGTSGTEQDKRSDAEATSESGAVEDLLPGS